METEHHQQVVDKKHNCQLSLPAYNRGEQRTSINVFQLAHNHIKRSNTRSVLDHICANFVLQ